MDKVTIIANATESNRTAALSKLPNVELEILPLTTGDFIFCRTGAVEVKGKFQQGHDFVASMGDGRMDDEIPRMLSVYPDSVLVVENPEAVWSTGFTHISIYGMQAKLCTYTSKEGKKWKIPTMFTTGIDGTALAIERLAFWTQHTPADKPVRLDKPKHMTEEEYVQGAFADTGPVLAQRLLEMFGSLWNIVNALGQTTVKETRGGNLKWGEGPLKKRILDLGPKWVYNNRILWKVP